MRLNITFKIKMKKINGSESGEVMWMQILFVQIVLENICVCIYIHIYIYKYMFVLLIYVFKKINLN